MNVYVKGHRYFDDEHGKIGINWYRHSPSFSYWGFTVTLFLYGIGSVDFTFVNSHSLYLKEHGRKHYFEFGFPLFSRRGMKEIREARLKRLTERYAYRVVAEEKK